MSLNCQMPEMILVGYLAGLGTINTHGTLCNQICNFGFLLWPLTDMILHSMLKSTILR